jgi:hypothetical protein
MALFFNGVAGTSRWSVSAIGLHSTISDAAPGSVLFVVGLFTIWITRFKMTTKYNPDATIDSVNSAIMTKYNNLYADIVAVLDENDLRDGVITGLSYCHTGELKKVTLDLLLNGRKVATFTADSFRPDLLNAGMGDGHYGFSIDLTKTPFDRDADQRSSPNEYWTIEINDAYLQELRSQVPIYTWHSSPKWFSTHGHRERFTRLYQQREIIPNGIIVSNQHTSTVEQS